MSPDHFTGNSNLIAHLNRSAILRLVKEQGPISRAEVAKRLSLHPATVGRIVAGLLASNLLVENGPAPSHGGRRPILLSYNQKAATVIGLDLDGAYILGVLADLGGDFIHRVEYPGSPDRDGAENLRTVYRVLEELLAFDAQTAQSVRGIGVASSSVTLNPEGIITNSAPLGWRNMPLRSLLEDRFGYPVFVENRSDLGALAESLWGAGQQAERLVWLDVGAGIGSGIVIGKRLYQGAHCAAGEVGFIVPDKGFLGQRFDTFGCMETLSSCAVMVEQAQRAVAEGDRGALYERAAANGRLTALDIFDAARAGDALALRLVDNMADYVSLIVVSIVSVLDPDLIVLAQDLAYAGDLFIPRIEARIAGVVVAAPRIVTSALKTEAAIRGAVALALQAMEEQFYVQQPLATLSTGNGPHRALVRG